MEKKIIKTGGSIAIVLTSTMREISGFNANDIIDVKCSAGKIILTKK